MGPTAVRLFAGALCGLSLLLSGLSLSQLHDENTAHDLRSELQTWQAQGYIEDTGKRREEVLFALNTISPQRVNSADLSLLAVQVQEWLAFEARLSRDRSLEMRKRGGEFALAVLMQRPSSSYGWTYFLSNALLQEGYSDRVKHALFRARDLGGWELQTQRYLAKWGINYWDNIDGEGQALVIDMVQRVLRSDSTHQLERIDLELMRVAHQRNWSHRLEPLLVNDDQRDQFQKIHNG